jgi:hypothetical protein
LRPCKGYLGEAIFLVTELIGTRLQGSTTTLYVKVAHLGPASIKRTDTFGSSERRDASTEPAVP